jgi:MarR family transcriptional regulator, 2-MHQ and catechol-resistance regulon repressor
MPTRCPGADRPPVEGVDDEAISTYGRILEVARRLEHVFEETLRAEGGPHGARFELLLRLGRSPGDELTMSELAVQLGVTSGGATRLVDRVAADDLVERRACTSDRRVHHVRLTERGRERLAAALEPHRRDLARELTSRLDPTSRSELDRILDLLRDPTEVAAVSDEG